MTAQRSKTSATAPFAHNPRGAAVGSPRVISDGEQLREIVRAAQHEGQSVGLVPTMGALHEGHLSLIDRARSECDLAVVTIFVNPRQFGPNEDFRRYPRDLEADVALLGERGCDVVFAPSVAAMYPDRYSTSVDVGALGQVLEGEHRPIHFRGVATIVLKLFQLAPADRAYFGRKDYQQTLVIQRMVADLNVPIEIRVCPIVREADGLAMSSRNAYLTADERRRARSLSQALRLAEESVAAGERDVEVVRLQMEQVIDRAGIELQYIAFLADGTAEPVDEITGPTTIAVAALAGTTRLIDNTVVSRTS